jgi:hypothetical protein
MYGFNKTSSNGKLVFGISQLLDVAHIDEGRLRGSTKPTALVIPKIVKRVRSKFQ